MLLLVKNPFRCIILTQKGYNTPILFAIIALSGYINGYILRFFFQRKFNKAGNGGMEYVGL